MVRKIYQELVNWKNATENKKPLMVLGVRQAGKTYIIQEFCKREFSSFVSVNLFENEDVVSLYQSNLTSDEKWQQLKVLLGVDIENPGTIFFIDEIQQCEELISELKYFCEKHNDVRIICAGSLLGVKLKRNKVSFPVGKVKMISMYPMDFEEFLIAMGEELLVTLIRDCYESNKKMAESVHEKALNLYQKYLITGGMPESVFSMVSAKGDYTKYDSTILENILDAYFHDMNQYVVSDAEALKIRRIYHSLPTQLSNLSHKFQYSKLGKDARARDYETPLDWLLASNMVLLSKCSKKPEIPLEGFVDMDAFKIYLSDVGILNHVLKLSMEDILFHRISLYKGIIAENYVANQLVSSHHDLYYWKDASYEIDFLISTKDGIIPVEVKAGESKKSKSLNAYMEKYHPSYAIRISTREFGYDPVTKIKSIPLYAVFLI